MRGFGSDAGELKESSALVPGVLRGYRRFMLLEDPAGRLLHYMSSMPDPRPYRMPTYAEWLEDPRILGAPTRTTNPLGLSAMVAPRLFMRPGENTARCLMTPYYGNSAWSHTAPGNDCICGFYGYYTPRLINDTGNGIENTVVAAVEVYGNVVLGTKGFRAEKLRLVALVRPTEYEARVHRYEKLQVQWRALVEAYGVPCFDTVDTMLATYPPQDVSELLPREKVDLVKKARFPTITAPWGSLHHYSPMMPLMYSMSGFLSFIPVTPDPVPQWVRDIATAHAMDPADVLDALKKIGITPEDPTALITW